VADPDICNLQLHQSLLIAASTANLQQIFS